MSTIEQGGQERLTYDNPLAAAEVIHGLSAEELTEVIEEAYEGHRRFEFVLEQARAAASKFGDELGEGLFLTDSVHTPSNPSDHARRFIPHPYGAGAIIESGLGGFLLEHGDTHRQV